MAHTDQTASTRPYGGVSAADRIAGRRARLLRAGLQLFGTQGYTATGVKDVCRDAGLTDRYYYESFADSQQLFLAVFDAVTDELFQSVAAAVLEQSVPEQQLRAAIGTFLRALADEPRKARVVFSEAAAAGPAALQHMNATLRRFADLVVLTARPNLPGWPEAKVRIAALALVGMLERVVVEWQDGQLEPCSIDGIVEDCASVYLALLPR